MKKVLLVIFSVLVIGAASGYAFLDYRFNQESDRTYQVKEFTIHDEVLLANTELGKRLYTVRSGCIDCHGENLAGALIMKNGAMGTIWGANISPYTLQYWTDEEIARSVRYGVGKDGRSLRFMPSFDYQGLSKGDLAALIAYLRSMPSVEKPSVINRYGPVAKALSLSGKMPIMFPAKMVDLNAGFAVKPEEGPTVEFGRYLAQSCVGCHGHEFRGGVIEGGDPSWPEASNIRLGSKAIWTEAVFAEMMKTGISPTSKEPLRAPMPVKLMQQMNDTEVKALWEYLKTLN